MIFQTIRKMVSYVSSFIRDSITKLTRGRAEVAETTTTHHEGPVTEQNTEKIVPEAVAELKEEKTAASEQQLDEPKGNETFVREEVIEKTIPVAEEVKEPVAVDASAEETKSTAEQAPEEVKAEETFSREEVEVIEEPITVAEDDNKETESIPVAEQLIEPVAVEVAEAQQTENLAVAGSQNTALKSAIEALLFISGSPLSLERLVGVFEDASPEEIEAQLQSLKQDYITRGAGIMLAEVAGGYQLVTRPENATWIRKFKAVKVSTKLSRPALETLAIIAYKQPITRTEIELVRGVNIGGIARNLMERRLVKIVGKKDVPGKPMLYGTTPEFLQYFGLKDLTALPTLKEFQELEAGEEVMETSDLIPQPAEREPETTLEEASTGEKSNA